MRSPLLPSLALTLGLCIAGCSAPSNVTGGEEASHVETSACEGDRNYCECVHAAEISGVSIADAQLACRQ